MPDGRGSASSASARARGRPSKVTRGGWRAARQASARTRRGPDAELRSGRAGPPATPLAAPPHRLRSAAASAHGLIVHSNSTPLMTHVHVLAELTQHACFSKQFNSYLRQQTCIMLQLFPPGWTAVARVSACSMPLPAQQRGGDSHQRTAARNCSNLQVESAPMAPSASFMAQKRRKAMAFRLTSRLCGLLVKAIRQFTQSVKVVTCASLHLAFCSEVVDQSAAGN